MVNTVVWLLLCLNGAEADSAPSFGTSALEVWLRFRRFDENEDSKVSREEFNGPARVFERMDANEDGLVTKDEIESRFEERRKERPAEPLRPSRRRQASGRIGAKAPQVTAQRLDGTGEVNLGRPKRLTVLVFSSYT